MMAINLDALIPELDEVIADDVSREQAQQKDQWGYQLENTNGTWLAVLVEEVGEVAQTLLKQKDTDAQDTYQELVQVAAVAMSWARAIEANKVLDAAKVQSPTTHN